MKDWRDCPGSQITVMVLSEFTTLGITANTDTSFTQGGELGQALVPIPLLKQANKQLEELQDSKLTQDIILSAFRLFFGRYYGSTILL